MVSTGSYLASLERLLLKQFSIPGRVTRTFLGGSRSFRKRKDAPYLALLERLLLKQSSVSGRVTQRMNE